MPEPELDPVAPEEMVQLTEVGTVVAGLYGGVEDLMLIYGRTFQAKRRAEAKIAAAQEAYKELPQEVQFKLAELCRNRPGPCWCGSHVADLMADEGNLNAASAG